MTNRLKVWGVDPSMPVVDCAAEGLRFRNDDAASCHGQGRPLLLLRRSCPTCTSHFPLSLRSLCNSQERMRACQHAAVSSCRCWSTRWHLSESGGVICYASSVTQQTHLRQRQLVNGHIGHALDLLHAGKGFSCNQFGASYGCCCSRAPWLTETSAILKSTPGISHLRK
ncbi:hypothetical protein WJX73_001301 [Symbiochloris irregularis]|uniref:Uncharacterized protein n=1 Tax=Symbiochloris irregularis TaxID=706552 RepID=A0AAW1NN89_9CHLO